MTNQTRAYFFAGITVLLWSTVATAFKVALRTQEVFQVLMIASITSTVILFLNLWLSGRTASLQTGRKALLRSALSGLLNPFLYYLILFKAYENLPAQVAQPLNMVWPLVLVLISIPMLGQKITSWNIISLIISFLGILLVSSQGWGRAFKPDQIPYMILALSTSFIWSFFWILNMRDKREENEKLFMSFLFSSIYLLIFSAWVDNPFPVKAGEWLVNIYIGLFEMGLAFLFWNKALRLSKTTDTISNLVFIFPFISLIFIHYILGEEIHLTTFLGLILVISGITIQQFKRKRP